MISFSNFIILKQDSLQKEFCEHVIEKFDRDERKSLGVVGQERVYVPDLKRSTDLMITFLDEWIEEDKVFFNSLGEGLENYGEQEFLKGLPGEDSGKIGILDEQLIDTGYQIQRTDPGGFYNWHQDWSQSRDMGSRVLTYIWYLNDVTQGGYTEFLDGTRIIPKQGNLLIFPAILPCELQSKHFFFFIYGFKFYHT